MSRAVIITSYLEYPLDIHALLQPDDLIVCLDGGYNIAQRLALQPDLLLGDFDSLEGPLPEPEAMFEETEAMGAAGDSLPRNTMKNSLLREHHGGKTCVPEIRRYPPEKDYTDLELAFRTLDPAVTPDLLVIGGLGGRLDQTIVNIQMLQKYTASPAEWQAKQTERDSNTPPGNDKAACDPENGEAVCDPENGETVCDSISAAAARDAEAANPPKGGNASFGSFRQYRSIQLIDGRNRCFIIHGSEEAVDEKPISSYTSVDANTKSPGAAMGPGLRSSVESTGMDPEIHRIPRVPDSYLSLIPLTDECSGVDLQGVKYPLSNATLHRGVSLSVSNEFLEGHAELRLRRGSLLVITAGGSSCGFQTNWRND